MLRFLLLLVALYVPQDKLFAQSYRGWEYLGKADDGASVYARLMLRREHVVVFEFKYGGDPDFIVFADCDKWVWTLGPAHKNKALQIMPGSSLDLAAKKYC
jgi:hypothetical protein